MMTLLEGLPVRYTICPFINLLSINRPCSSAPGTSIRYRGALSRSHIYLFISYYEQHATSMFVELHFSLRKHTCYSMCVLSVTNFVFWKLNWLQIAKDVLQLAFICQFMLSWHRAVDICCKQFKVIFFIRSGFGNSGVDFNPPILFITSNHSGIIYIRILCVCSVTLHGYYRDNVTIYYSVLVCFSLFSLIRCLCITIWALMLYLRYVASACSLLYSIYVRHCFSLYGVIAGLLGLQISSGYMFYCIVLTGASFSDVSSWHQYLITVPVISSYITTSSFNRISEPDQL